MKNLIDRVRWVLTHYEQARNDDTYLCVCLWQEFYLSSRAVQDPFPIHSSGELYQFLKDVPDPEDIVRARQKLQAQGELLPTSEAVLRLRRQKTVLVREALGYQQQEA